MNLTLLHGLKLEGSNNPVSAAAGAGVADCVAGWMAGSDEEGRVGEQRFGRSREDRSDVQLGTGVSGLFLSIHAAHSRHYPKARRFQAANV